MIVGHAEDSQQCLFIVPFPHARPTYVRPGVSAGRCVARPDLQFFTSYNEPRLTNWSMLRKVLSFPTVVDLYARLLFFVFFVRCTNLASFAGCCIRRGH